MELFVLDIEGGLRLADKVDPKYQPIFEALSPGH